jgi:hypothetical protein
MNNKLFRWLDPILLIGIFISITIAVGMVLSGNDTLSGLMVGLLSTIITLIIDQIAKTHKLADLYTKSHDYSILLSDEIIKNFVQKIAKNYDFVKKYNFELYKKIADIALSKCEEKLREIASGSISVEAASGFEHGMLVVRQATKDIKTIHIGSMEFWKSDFGKNYFEINRAAIKSGVTITRLFGLTSDSVASSIEILKDHQKAGINVYIINPERIDHEFSIIDNRIWIDFSTDESRDCSGEQIILVPEKVKMKVEEYEQLIIKFATPLNDIVSKNIGGSER